MKAEKKPRLITFDVYSALLDVHSGLVFHLQASFDLSTDQASRLAAEWRAKQLERAALSNSLDIGRVSFRDCTRDALKYVCYLEKIELNNQLIENLCDIWDYLPPWPDANKALEKLRANNFDLAILSNGDIKMLEKVSKQFSVEFKYVLSSETVDVYKPHRRVYDMVSKISGLLPEEILHVAGGRNDVTGCVIAGLPCVWINRKKDNVLDHRYLPNLEISNLTNLVSIIC